MTPRLLRTHYATLLSLLLAAMSSPAFAADDSDNSWYQIDLLVFKNLSTVADAEEQWRKELHLNYPEQLIKLKAAEQYAREFCFSESNTAAKDEMDQFSCLEYVSKNPGLTWPPLVEDDIVTPEADPLPGAGEKDSTKKVTDSFLPPPPYVLLKSPEQEIQESERSLNRSSRYRVIFSGSWAQQLTDRQQSPHILIQGGQAFDDHFELEGHIKVSLERYLHVATDLWLSRFQPIPRHLIDGSGAMTDNQYGASSLASDNIWPLLPQAKPVNDPSTLKSPDNDPGDISNGNSFDQAGLIDATHYGAEPLPAEPETSPRSNIEALIADDKEYFVERTVVLRQQRRMRSGELHYLDHPLFGALVKITPLPRDDKGSEDAN